MEIGGHLLPGGRAVAPCIHLIHRRPDVYPEPRALPARALPRAAGRHVHLDPVRRRRAPLPRRELRAVRDDARCFKRSSRRSTCGRRSPPASACAAGRSRLTPGRGASVVAQPRLPARASGCDGMSVDPTGADLKRFMAEDPGGPVVMLNLLRFKPDGRPSYEQLRARDPAVSREGRSRSPVTSATATPPSWRRTPTSGTPCCWCATRAARRSARWWPTPSTRTSRACGPRHCRSGGATGDRPVGWRS